MAPGRPRGFDIELALAEALRVFLAKGYDGASLADLTQAMGINPPSLYAAFGNKEGLFRSVLQRYEDARGVVLARALAEPTAASVVERFLRESITDQTLDDRTHGCLLVQGALACGDQAHPVREDLSRARLAGQLRLAERFAEAQREGEIDVGVDVEALSGYVGALVHGFAVQAASGISRTQLLRLVDVTMKGWPAIVAAHPRKARRRSQAA